MSTMPVQAMTAMSGKFLARHLDRQVVVYKGSVKQQHGRSPSRRSADARKAATSRNDPP